MSEEEDLYAGLDGLEDSDEEFVINDDEEKKEEEAGDEGEDEEGADDGTAGLDESGIQNEADQSVVKNEPEESQPAQATHTPIIKYSGGLTSDTVKRSGQRLFDSSSKHRRTSIENSGINSKTYPKYVQHLTMPGGKKSAFEIDIDELEEQPWRKMGANMEDYFNYGFNEDKWREYAAKQVALKLQSENESQLQVVSNSSDPNAIANSNAAIHGQSYESILAAK